MNVKRNSDTSENSLYPKKGRLLYRCLRRLPKRTDPQDYSDRLLHSNANAASIIEPAASTGKMAAHVSHRGHDMSYSVTPIGIVRSCFKEKFAIPRQPQLAPAARGVLELHPPFDQAHALEGLEQVSHVWLLFMFHQALEAEPRLRVRPPRLGGNRMVGVFATRATHRPNGIGQSVVRLERIEPGRLHLSGIDLLDGTPVLDIKPYVPYADSVAEARNDLAAAAPEPIAVHWTETSLEQVRREAIRLEEPLQALIEQCLAQDPRPAYQTPAPDRRYGTRLWDVDVRWHYPDPASITVVEVSRAQH